MPRPRRPGAPEPKRRSRKGCWPCKARKVKCGEEKPVCLNCRRQNEQCDYSIRLNWGGRKRMPSVDSPSSQSSTHSAQLFFALSPPDVQLDCTDAILPADPLNVAEGANVPNQDMENVFWESEFAQKAAVEASSPRGLHDIQEFPAVTEQSSRAPYRTDDKTPVELSPSSRIPGHPSSFTSSIDTMPYPFPADTSPSIGSLASLNWSPATVSQPISFLRQSVNKYRPTNGYDGHLNSFPGTDATGGSPIYSYSSPSRLELLPPDSRSRDCFLPTNSSPRDPGLHANTPTSPEDFFATTMDAPLQSPQNGTCNDSKADAPSYTPHGRASQGLNEPSGSTSEKMWHTYLTSVTDNYGLDCGRPDLDLNQNDDHSAIDINYALSLVNPKIGSLSDTTAPSSPEKKAKTSSQEGYAYYRSSVPVNIPRYLSPLPATLVQTPINLMYFHHFLNHTARMLVPHDCGNNPFITVLPSMAIGDSNLLNLMLAYSASHRARYLKHPEPANRIAHWVSDVFPALRLALEDSHKKTTDNHLAAAIMLLSLKIVSPSTFEVPIPWQSHLKLARDLFLARQEQMIYPGSRVGAFLTRWLGYLDIMGTLSCRHSEPPLLAYFSSLNTCCIGEKYDEYCVDCFTGFTPRTGLFLMRLGQLVHQCDNEQFDETGSFISEWTPSADIIFEAQTLLADLDELSMHAHANGRHFQDSLSTDIVSMDQAFRHAGLIHLQRRVLGVSTSSAMLKKALDELLKSLVQIRSGSSAEVGAVFPLFTAGCESRDFEQRTEIQARFELLESTGLKQIQNARKLVQRCWEEDRPWIALAQGEFLG